jgi:hypothetical protein
VTHKLTESFLVFLLVTGTASAFPPAPYYTLHGMVRDQVGQTVTAEGAVVILLKGGVEVGRTPITSNHHHLEYFRTEANLLPNPKIFGTLENSPSKPKKSPRPLTAAL